MYWTDFPDVQETSRKSKTKSVRKWVRHQYTFMLLSGLLEYIPFKAKYNLPHKVIYGEGMTRRTQLPLCRLQGNGGTCYSAVAVYMFPNRLRGPQMPCYQWFIYGAFKVRAPPSMSPTRKNLI